MESKATDEQAKHLWIRDIKTDESVRGTYLVKEKRLGTTRKGEPFVSMTLADRTGDIEAKIWERADAFARLFSVGDVMEVAGQANSYRDRLQITVSQVRTPTEKPDPSVFLESSPHDPSKMLIDLRALLKEVKNTALRALIDSFLADRRFVSQFKKAPAAKSFHHAYLGGLLEHTLSVCQMAANVAHHYPQLDRDLLLVGAFIHDIGKIREFTFELNINYSDEGRLLGHIVLGAAMLEEKLKGLKQFPRELALRLKHLLVSHHGEFEFGSPRRPKFLEGFALHLIDDLDAKICGLGRFMERDREAGAWTGFNRLFERYFLKGQIPSFETERAGEREEDGQQGVLFES